MVMGARVRRNERGKWGQAGRDTAEICEKAHRILDFPQMLHVAEWLQLDTGNGKAKREAIRVVA